MDDDPSIDASGLGVLAFLTIMCFGFWIFFWIAEWPPTRLQTVVTAGGLLLGLIYCIDRIQNWDVRAWQWREVARNRTYTPILYRLAMFGAPLGVLTVQIARGFISQEIRYAVMSAIFAGMGLVFGWGGLKVAGISCTIATQNDIVIGN